MHTYAPAVRNQMEEEEREKKSVDCICFPSFALNVLICNARCDRFMRVPNVSTRSLTRPNRNPATTGHMCTARKIPPHTHHTSSYTPSRTAGASQHEIDFVFFFSFRLSYLFVTDTWFANQNSPRCARLRRISRFGESCDCYEWKMSGRVWLIGIFNLAFCINKFQPHVCNAFPW